MAECFNSNFKLISRLNRIVLYILVGLISIFLSPNFTLGATSKPFTSKEMVATLITAENKISSNTRTISAGLSITLEKGWKTYWRSPGQVGLPPEIDWEDSTNVLHTKFYWPTPERFQEFEIENYGYSNKVTFPINIVLKNPGKPLSLIANTSILVCKDVCLPKSFILKLSLSEVEVIDRLSRIELSSSLTTIPIDGPNSQFKLNSVFIDPNKKSLFVEIQSLKNINEVHVFPETQTDVIFDAPINTFDQDKKLVTIQLPIFDYKKINNPIALTISNGKISSTYKNLKIVENIVHSQSNILNGNGFAIIIFFAFVGGLILNVMPCVFPVLLIKINSVINSQSYSKIKTRRKFISSALGIITFMWILNGLLFLIQVMGGKIGWGVQFQSPVFLSFIIVILIIFSINMLGGLKIILPQKFNTKLYQLSNSNGFIGDFLSGCFAALLATPCSAPFLGSAVAFALTMGGVQSLIIFSFIGLGLASPYLVVATAPRLVMFFPRPGKWMKTVQNLIGILIIISACWFSWLLISVESFQSLLVLLIALIFAILSLKFIKINSLKYVFFVTFLILSVTNSTIITSQNGWTTNSDSSWEVFDTSRKKILIDSEKVVFIDITADWCLTCKANKLLVLDSSYVKTALSKENVVKMRGDWTQKNSKILSFLKENGRFGIPFNIVYGPSAKSGIMLPEILTSEVVINALKNAE